MINFSPIFLPYHKEYAQPRGAAENAIDICPKQLKSHSKNHRDKDHIT